MNCSRVQWKDDQAQGRKSQTVGPGESIPSLPSAPSEIVTLDSSWLVDLTSGFDLTRNVNLFARVTNLLDEDYEQVYGYQTRDRSGFVGVRVNFGQ